MAENPSVAIQPGILDERSPGLMALVERFDAIPIEDLLVYLIDHVDTSVLPYLVDQFDMGDFIRETTPEATTRAMLKNAIALKRKLGTEWAVKFVAESLGLPIEFIDWHQGDLPRHTFKARAWAAGAAAPMDAWHQAELQRLITVAKRTSQHETIEMGLATNGNLAAGIALDVGVLLEIDGLAGGRDTATAPLAAGIAADAGVVLDLDGVAGGRDTLTATRTIVAAGDFAQTLEFGQ